MTLRRYEYNTFELFVGYPASDGYPITVVQAPAGDARGISHLDPSDADLQRILRAIEERRTDSSTLARLGELLFQGIFVDTIAACYRESLVAARARGNGLRVRLHIQPPELAALPWEYLRDNARETWLATNPQTPLVRYVPTGPAARALSIDAGLRILVVISTPKDLYPLDTTQEKRTIEDALKGLIADERVQVEFVQPALIGVINETVRRFRPHVFHFIGHGQFQHDRPGHDDSDAYHRGLGVVHPSVEGEPAHQRGATLYLEDEAGNAHPVPENKFRELFSGTEDTRLVALNACRTGTTSTSEPFVGLAPRLLQRELPAVVAMQSSILDDAALVFARNFYSSLALGYPVDAAISEARKGMFLEVGADSPDWGMPVLFLRSKDGQLFDVSSAASKPATDTESARAESEQGTGRHTFTIGDISGANVNVGGEQTFTGPLNIDMSSQDDELNLSGKSLGAALNIESQLENATQTISTIPYADASTKQQLTALTTQLNKLLQQTPPDQVAAAEKVAKRVAVLVYEANQPDPDEEMIAILGNTLVTAAKQLEQNKPDVLVVVKQIVKGVRLHT